MNALRRVLLAIVLFLFLPAAAGAESPARPAARTAEKLAQPLWEIGLFGVAFRMPQYRGSDEYDTYVLPLPYLIYRGDIFRVKREGAKGVFLRSEAFEADISLFGNPPVRDDNEARRGMEDLDALFEVGPALNWYFLGRRSVENLYLRSALRSVFSIGLPDDLRTRYEGLHGEMNLVYFDRALFDDPSWQLGLSLGVDFGDREYNSYYYDVPRKDVRPERPFFKADSGYAGCKASASLVKRLSERFSLWGYVKWQNVDGAVFEDSPLVKEHNNFSLGFAFVWKISASGQTARYAEEGTEAESN